MLEYRVLSDRGTEVLVLLHYETTDFTIEAWISPWI